MDIGILSWPAALPDWNWFAIVIISSSVAKSRKIDWLKIPDRNVLWDVLDYIPLAKFGPILEKYWQNLFAIARVSGIVQGRSLL